MSQTREELQNIYAAWVLGARLEANLHNSGTFWIELYSYEHVVSGGYLSEHKLHKACTGVTPSNELNQRYRIKES